MRVVAVKEGPPSGSLCLPHYTSVYHVTNLIDSFYLFIDCTIVSLSYHSLMSKRER